ncbi:MAG TPA: hypothetical protein VGF97_00180 [Rhizomicrobium sp.]|jgi:hypothetical protein
MANGHKYFGSIRLLPKAYPLLSASVLTVMSLALAIAIKGWANHWNFANVKDYTDISLNTFLGVAIVEFVYVLYQLYFLEDKIASFENAVSALKQEDAALFQGISSHIDAKALLIRKMAIRNHDQHNVTHKFLKVFHYHGMPAHDAVREAIVSLARNFSVEDDAISFDSEFLSREMYQNFWRALIAAQIQRRHVGAPDLVVRITHSASVKLWKSPQFEMLYILQKKFLEEHGLIYRVLLRGQNSADHVTDYAAVIERMTDEGIKAYYLDVGKSIGEPMQDYILASFGDQHYAIIWRADLDVHGHFGSIKGSEIKIGLSRCMEYWTGWEGVMVLLDKKKKKPDPHLTGFLALTPDDDDFKIMKELP